MRTTACALSLKALRRLQDAPNPLRAAYHRPTQLVLPGRKVVQLSHPGEMSKTSPCKGTRRRPQERLRHESVFDTSGKSPAYFQHCEIFSRECNPKFPFTGTSDPVHHRRPPRGRGQPGHMAPKSPYQTPGSRDPLIATAAARSLHCRKRTNRSRAQPLLPALISPDIARARSNSR